jgi:hypothetical protein
MIPPPDSGLTEEDVIRALDLWRKHAPPRWRSLLTAPEIGGKSDD